MQGTRRGTDTAFLESISGKIINERLPMTAEHIRRCPGCGTENASSLMRCVCGVLLAGVDITRRRTEPDPASNPVARKIQDNIATPAICAHDDCGQENPPGSASCLYCNRPLSGQLALTQSEPLQSLVNLPAALKDRYRIIKPMPTRGAEAELLLVQALAGGSDLVAKIYRHGILPRREVQQRISNIPVAHRVNVMEEGVSDGYAYELMELCKHGSLRQMMASGTLKPELLNSVVHELAIALQAVHAVSLVHRDLKPENILIRTQQPLDLVLTDFSIASILDVTQRFTGVARTLPYAAPESLSGVIDFKSDYWAMGMIILEAAQGKHPFSGLSEAVVMHHLSTRNIDLSAVSDRNLRKLLLGLFQRDPALRWGAAEIQRWLKHDASLAEPAEQGSLRSFNEPYHLGSELCHKPEQLAVALARNWQAGLADISNGQLLAWFRDVQKDQNVVRLLIEMRSQASLSLNVQLLKLILHLAPGMPPVWQGETIELSTILGYANQALKGETDAAWWLDNLYQNRVLEFYADAGNRQAADLVQRWNRALDQFNQTWKSKLALISDKSQARDPDTVADFDELMYGRKDLLRPSLVHMHARLLAMSYDNSWAERLRKRVMAEMLGLSAKCAWINDLGDPQQMDAAALLVLEALLPEAKKSVEFQLKKRERSHTDMLRETDGLRDETHNVLAAIRHTATSSLPTASVCEELHELLDDYFMLITQIRAASRTDQEWMDFKKQTLRTQTSANIMLDTLNKLSQHRAISSGWLSIPVVSMAAFAIFLSPVIFPGIRTWLFLAAFSLVAWRLLPDYWMMRSIQKLGEVF
jgi:tRNA A-37 threonylcarbamoyl transferase component Bud32